MMKKNTTKMMMKKEKINHFSLRARLVYCPAEKKSGERDKRAAIIIIIP